MKSTSPNLKSQEKDSMKYNQSQCIRMRGSLNLIKRKYQMNKIMQENQVSAFKNYLNLDFSNF